MLVIYIKNTKSQRLLTNTNLKSVCCFVYKYFLRLLPACFSNTFQFNSQAA